MLGPGRSDQRAYASPTPRAAAVGEIMQAG